MKITSKSTKNHEKNTCFFVSPPEAMEPTTQWRVGHLVLRSIASGNAIVRFQCPIYWVCVFLNIIFIIFLKNNYNNQTAGFCWTVIVL
jgi:hypothetical protein